MPNEGISFGRIVFIPSSETRNIYLESVLAACGGHSPVSPSISHPIIVSTNGTKITRSKHKLEKL